MWVNVEVTVTSEVTLFLQCSKCGRALKSSYRKNQLTLVVDACPVCLEDARLEGCAAALSEKGVDDA